MPIGMNKVSRSSKKPSVIPDSVVNQYDVIADFSQGDTTIQDGVGTDDMSLTGDIQDATIGGESGGVGDGSDDHGESQAQTIGSNTTFGIAFTFRWPGSVNDDHYAGVIGDGDVFHRLAILSGNVVTPGGVGFDIGDSNGNFLRVTTNNGFDDGNAHLAVINKTSASDANDIDIYIDDMSSPAASTVDVNGSFDPANYSISRDIYYWAINNTGTPDNHTNVIYGLWEFNSDPYTKSERTGLKDRRPEV